MKLRLLTVAFLVTSLFAIGQTKVGTVDSELIIGLMPESKKIISMLSDYAQKLDSSYQVKIKEYEDSVAAFKKLGDVSDDFKKIKVDEITELERGLQTSQENANKLIQLKRDELMRPLYKKLSEVISEVSKAEGFSHILTTTGNQFAYIDETLDITQVVMDKMGIKIPEPENKE